MSMHVGSAGMAMGIGEFEVLLKGIFPLFASNQLKGLSLDANTSA